MQKITFGNINNTYNATATKAVTQNNNTFSFGRAKQKEDNFTPSRELEINKYYDRKLKALEALANDTNMRNEDYFQMIDDIEAERELELAKIE